MNTRTLPHAAHPGPADPVRPAPLPVITLTDPQPGPLWLDLSLGADGVEPYYRSNLPARLTGGQTGRALPLVLDPEQWRACMRRLAAVGRLPSGQEPAAVADLSDLLSLPSFSLSGLGSPIILPAGSAGPVTMPPFIRALRKAGALVVVEVDDDLGALTEDWDALVKHLSATAPGAAVDDPADGVASWGGVLRAANGVVCSTAPLAAVVRAYNPRVVVAGNFIDSRDFSTATRPADGLVHVGYGGTLSHHGADLDFGLPALVAAMRRDDVRVHFFGVCPGVLKPGPPDRLQAGLKTYGGRWYAYHPATHFQDYHREIGCLDVAVAPLGLNQFNQSKSACKWFEHSLHGTAMVVADQPAYACVEHGRTGFKASTPEDFARYVARLIEDPDLRRRIGAAAREQVLREHGCEAGRRAWSAALATMQTWHDAPAQWERV